MQLLTTHEMRGEVSCVAWGYEFIAKWHGRLNQGEYPLQTEHRAGLGFSPEDRQKFLERFGIATEERWLPVGELLPMIREQCLLELPPILSIFSRATVIYGEAIGIKRDHHIFVGNVEEDGRNHCFASRAYRHPEPFYLWIHHVRAIQDMSYVLPLPTREINCLLHRPA